MEQPPLNGHGDNNSQEDSYQDVYRKFQRSFQFDSFFNLIFASFFSWIGVLIASAFITYIVNNWRMGTVDPNICVSDRGRLTALIISLLFGSTGADRFYLGYPVSACFKALLGGFFHIWWIIDLISLWMGAFYDVNGCILK
ncbi:hypothetical protein BDF21DRAFT_416086 [Thamnidium elegans]|nr:hypothetical protein BDF21DRAFT_416086 [Thamnidium elegans]